MSVCGGIFEAIITLKKCNVKGFEKFLYYNFSTTKIKAATGVTAFDFK